VQGSLHVECGGLPPLFAHPGLPGRPATVTIKSVLRAPRASSQRVLQSPAEQGRRGKPRRSESGSKLPHSTWALPVGRGAFQLPAIAAMYKVLIAGIIAAAENKSSKARNNREITSAK